MNDTQHSFYAEIDLVVKLKIGRSTAFGSKWSTEMRRIPATDEEWQTLF